MEAAQQMEVRNYKQTVEDVGNMFYLKGQVAVVTGGAGALGSARALGLATYGPNVDVVVYVSEP